MLAMEKLIMVALGGSVGAALRYLVSAGVQSIGGITFPFGTLAVNVLGCLAIGFLTEVFVGPVMVRESVKVMILVGVLGGFTTFSTFGMETLRFLQDGQYAPAIMNVLLNNALGLAAVWIGYRWAQRLYGV